MQLHAILHIWLCQGLSRLNHNCAGGRPPRKQRYKPQLTAASYRYFIRGQSEKSAADDFKVSKQKRIQLKQYDRLLKSFQYREALDAAVATGRPEIVSSLVEELAARSGLPAALGEHCFYYFIQSWSLIQSSSLM